MDSGTSPDQGAVTSKASDADSSQSAAAAASETSAQRAAGLIPNPTFISATSAPSIAHFSSGISRQASSAGFRLATSSASAGVPLPSGMQQLPGSIQTEARGPYVSMPHHQGSQSPRHGLPGGNGLAAASSKWNPVMIRPHQAVSSSATFPQRVVMRPSLVTQPPRAPLPVASSPGALAPPAKRPCLPQGQAQAQAQAGGGVTTARPSFWTIHGSSASSMSASMPGSMAMPMSMHAPRSEHHRMLGRLVDPKTPFGERGRSPLDLPLPAVGSVPLGARPVQRRRSPMPPPSSADGPSHFVFRPPSPRVPQFAASSPTYEHLPARTPAVFPQYGEVDPACRYVGVRKSEGSYWACVERLGTSRWLGPFSSAAAAARAVDTALLLFHGREAVTNFSYDLDTVFADEKEAKAEDAVAQTHAEFYADSYRVKRERENKSHKQEEEEADNPQSPDAPEQEEQPDAKTKDEGRRPRRAAAQRAQYTLQRAGLSSGNEEEDGDSDDERDDNDNDEEERGEEQSDTVDGQADEAVPIGSLHRA